MNKFANVECNIDEFRMCVRVYNAAVYLVSTESGRNVNNRKRRNDKIHDTQTINIVNRAGV